MIKSTTSVVALALALLARTASAGEVYDDRVVMKNVADLAVAVMQAVPGPRECDSRSSAFGKDPIKGKLADLDSIGRKMRTLARGDGAAEINRLRRAAADKTAAFVRAVKAYGASAVSYASTKKQVETHKKTKPSC